MRELDPALLAFRPLTLADLCALFVHLLALSRGELQ